jgi:two-component system chemotaxis response regulator CheY
MLVERTATSAARKHLMNSSANNRDRMVQSLAVLIVDDNQYMRKVLRNILVSIGVKNIHEAVDGIAGLEAIRMFGPDLVILDWEMPLLNGAELVRIVRSPGVFPMPDVPIIMLSGHAERWRVIEASRLGVNEFLMKPVSGKAILDRIMAILTQPRAMVRLGDYYGPEPRKLFFEPVQKAAAPEVPPLALPPPAAKASADTVML